MFKLIVGLGNPEEKYINTRHNIGFKVIDEITKSLNILDTGLEELDGYRCISDNSVIFLKPYTTMNYSGNSVKQYMNQYDIKIEDILVIVDDIALPFGKLRIRESGSDGRHKGMKSIIDSIGSNKFNRLKIGIDKPKDNTILYDYVLSDFNNSEMEKLPNILSTASSAVNTWIEKGCQTAMNIYNNI